MKRWLRDNSLSLVTFAVFLAILVGQSFVGLRNYNDDLQQHQQPTVSYVGYIGSGDFIESVFENWESEFLQMSFYVILTIFLFQKGSAESKKLQGTNASDAKPKHTHYADALWPVRRGGWVLKIYEHSLSLALLILFLMSFWLHAFGGAKATCQENMIHQDPSCPTTISYMTTSKFWFESLQNWQSEFLAVFSIIYLSIYLREKGSPESKPVSAPNYHTGSE